jgi:hypothetical protein
LLVPQCSIILRPQCCSTTRRQQGVSRILGATCSILSQGCRPLVAQPSFCILRVTRLH